MLGPGYYPNERKGRRYYSNLVEHEYIFKPVIGFDHVETIPYGGSKGKVLVICIKETDDLTIDDCRVLTQGGTFNGKGKVPVWRRYSRRVYITDKVHTYVQVTE